MDFDEIGLERLWLVTFLAGVVATVAGAIAFPGRFRDGFLWEYFWGPVVADAHNASCAARIDGTTHIGECNAEIVATPGYTAVSTVSYAVVLLFMLVGVYFLLERIGAEFDRTTVYAFFPFVPLGGALRTVEDANVLFLADGSAPIPFPYSALIISPFIYFVVFGVALGALVLGVVAAERGIVERYQHVVAVVGTIGLVGTLSYLGYLVVTTDLLGFNWSVPAITLGGATILAALTWWVGEQYLPELNKGTGLAGVLVIWGHAVDGVANVLSLDWADTFGLRGYEPKHVVNEAIHVHTPRIQPDWLTDLIGATWPFIPLKVGAAAVVVYLFNEEVIEESPRYSYLLLIAVLAVGLGPGTRDFLRATFGI